MKQGITIITAMVMLAVMGFLFGWTARGDAIYSGMFMNTVSTIEGLK